MLINPNGNHNIYPYSLDIPTTFQITNIQSNKTYKGNSKDIVLIAIKLKNGGYYLRFKNHEFTYKLLDNKYINIIDEMLKVNSRNIEYPTYYSGSSITNENGKIFKKVLDKKDNFKIINSFLFVFMYQWFTDLPLHYLDEVIMGGRDEKRTEITSKNLIIINGDIQEHITNRSGLKFPNYQDFKKWLRNNYKNGNISFLSLINNEGLESYNDDGNKIYIIDDEKYITEDEDIPDNNTTDLQELKNMPYKEYLQTGHWKNIRKQALFRAKYKCQLCGDKSKLNVHHNTYENRGEEKDEDLIVLCQDCHSKFHNKF